MFLRQLTQLLVLGHPGISAAVSGVPFGTLTKGTLFLPLLRMCHYLDISYFSVCLSVYFSPEMSSLGNLFFVILKLLHIEVIPLLC